MKKKTLFFYVASLFLFTACTYEPVVYNLSDYGILPNSSEDVSPLLEQAIEKIKKERKSNEPITIQFAKGTYNFYPEKSATKEYFISNHDQDNPKQVGLPFEGMNNVTVDGDGADFIFHGRMLPLSVVGDTACLFKNFSIDFKNPHISQVKVLENDTINHLITYEVAPWVEYEVKEGTFIAKGLGWQHTPSWGIAFEEETKRLVYRTSDIALGTRNVKEIAPRTLQAPWKNSRLIPGTVVAMRSYGRPTPGIFVTHSKDITFDNVTVHYAEGMGLLAQMSENLTLDGFSVALRGESDPRYFTTQADATHFSGCKGKIISKNGLYEGMMDDAINVHGTYLKVVKRINPTSVIAAYMHSQSYGFEWGRVGDSVQFVNSATMELMESLTTIKSIRPYDKESVVGAKQYEIEFAEAIDAAITEEGVFGIENLEWTPEVYFADNVIRNNRARGTLFSTPKRTIVENNLFDHTSGTAILLCGDCNGWFETGACREVLIRNNRFINALAMMFQFTNAVISIYPEIPQLDKQTKYFHGGSKEGIVIENNIFETFDTPLLYAKSIDGLVFRNNQIIHNNDYPAYHAIQVPFFLERATNVVIENNQFDKPFNPATDIRLNLTDVSEVSVK
ncbi:MAG: right-handed parallel beta-helix repeat-containing protein [Phocaeicola sp.]